MGIEIVLYQHNFVSLAEMNIHCRQAIAKQSAERGQIGQEMGIIDADSAIGAFYMPAAFQRGKGHKTDWRSRYGDIHNHGMPVGPVPSGLAFGFLPQVALRLHPDIPEVAPDQVTACKPPAHPPHLPHPDRS